MDTARSFPALPELVLLCSWRMDSRKAKPSSRVQTAVGLGSSAPLQGQTPEPPAQTTRREKPNHGRVLTKKKGLRVGANPHSPCSQHWHTTGCCQNIRTELDQAPGTLGLSLVGAGSPPYLAVLINGDQALDRDVADVAPAEQDLPWNTRRGDKGSLRREGKGLCIIQSESSTSKHWLYLFLILVYTVNALFDWQLRFVHTSLDWWLYLVHKAR